MDTEQPIEETSPPVFVGAVGLLRRVDDDRSRFLLRYDECRGRLVVPFAQVLEGESFRDCVDREIGWLFDLRRGRDYIVSSVSRRRFEAESGRGLPCAFRLEFYVASTYGARSRERLDADTANVWASSEEVLGGVVGGRSVDETLLRVLRLADVLELE